MANHSASIVQLSAEATQEVHALRVLIVEDSPVQQLVLSVLMKQLGHTVSVASDGFEALSALQMDRYHDVILMDCKMPLMNGFQATRLIREAERLTGQQIAIIGISSSALAEECFEAGMDDFLCKPFNRATLKSLLGYWIRQKKGCSGWRQQNVN